MPSPGCVDGDLTVVPPAAGRAAGTVLVDVGVVEGDSVPMRDLRAAERGVIFPLIEGASSRPGDRVRTNPCLGREAGELGPEPASLGVKGLFVERKFALSWGVNGLPFWCLSTGMLVAGSDRVFGT